MSNYHLRAVLLKMQDCLNEDDRRRLHFLLGKDIPRHIRNDQSSSGTLSLIESLLEQDKISEQNLTILINALDLIQCLHGVRLLKDYLKQNQSMEKNPNKTSDNTIYNLAIEHDQISNKLNQSDCLTKFQFIIIDISNRLDQVSLAMLKSLNSMIEESILIMNDDSTIDFDLLPNKSTFLYVSSQFAVTMKIKPKQIEGIFILEDDKNKIDHYERFGSGMDLIFQLADEIYRCYRKEEKEYFLSGHYSIAKTKEKFSSKIHEELKRVYNTMVKDNNNNSMMTSIDTTTTIVWLRLTVQGKIEMERMRMLLSSCISSFLAFDNQSTCENYLLKNKSDGFIYLIINTDHKISIETVLQGVKIVYYYEQSNNFNDLCFQLLSDLAIHYNKLGSICSSKNDPKTSKDMFMKMYKLYNLLGELK